MTHEERVAAIAAQVRARGADRSFASLRKAAVSHMVPNPRDPRHRDQKIDASSLRHILSIDVAGRTCTAESGVSFCDLVEATLPHGLLPMLVPELRTITIGGAVSGCSVESMSYKYGGFHDSCLAYEYITGTGEVRTCSPEEDPLVFDMLHGSYGTLGILTRLTFRLIPARRHVHVRYLRLSGFDRFCTAMSAQMARADVDFIDGIAHGPGDFVLCLGQMCDQAPYLSDYKGRDIYYKSTAARAEDWLTTPDYLFRYDTDCHWLTRTLPGLERPLVRRLLGRHLLGSTNLLTWSARLRPLLRMQRRPPVVVDVFIPERAMAAFYQWYEREIDFYPLWLVPYRVPRPYAWLAEAQAAKAGGDLYLDCAIYGKRNDEPGRDYYRLLQDKTFELGGIKTLISTNQYDRETFWSIYHRDHYDEVKGRVDPQNLFRGLYEKFNG